MGNLFLEPPSWQILDWQDIPPWLVPPVLPNGSFRIKSNLTIEPLPDGSYLLRWKNDGDEDCSVSGLVFDPLTGTIGGKDLTITLGDRSLSPFEVFVQLGVKGYIYADVDDFPDTGSGTFTAMANAGPPPPDWPPGQRPKAGTR